MAKELFHPELVDLLVTLTDPEAGVDTDDIIADTGLTIKRANAGASIQYRGATQVVNMYGKTSYEVSGEAHPRWMAELTLGVPGTPELANAWHYYLCLAQDALLPIAATALSALADYEGTWIVGDLDEDVKETGGVGFKYGLKNHSLIVPTYLTVYAP
jgi:hypothetical protein